VVILSTNNLFAVSQEEKDKALKILIESNKNNKIESTEQRLARFEKQKVMIYDTYLNDTIYNPRSEIIRQNTLDYQRFNYIYAQNQQMPRFNGFIAYQMSYRLNYNCGNNYQYNRSRSYNRYR